jgi:predicted phosphohydrolase
VLRGNHDYYWNSLSKLRTAFPDFLFLQNNCIRIGNILIVGSRGWTIPTNDSSEEDVKIYKRELMRLKMSLDALKNQRCDDDYVIALLHFPPFDVLFNDSEVTAMLEEYRVDKVLYGHLHGKNARVNPTIEKNGITYHLTSCDLIGNKLIEVL